VPFLIVAFMISSKGSVIYESHFFPLKEETVPSRPAYCLFFVLLIICKLASVTC
jgi:hypothetical protein